MGRMDKIGRRDTTVWVDDQGWTNVRYHNTVVVRFNRGHIELDTGGWQTATTKARMNQTANQYGLDFYVFQTAFKWFVQPKGMKLIPFDGRRISLLREAKSP